MTPPGLGSVPGSGATGTDGIVLASRIEWDAATPTPPPAAAVVPAEVVPIASAPVVAPSAVPAPVEAAPAEAAPAEAVPAEAAPDPRRQETPSVPVAPDPGTEPGPGGVMEGLIDSNSVPSVVDAETLLPLDSALTPPAAPAVPLPPAGPAPAGDDEFGTGFDDVWGATVIRSADDGPARLGEDVEAAPAAPPAGDHDGATISLAQARALRQAAGEPRTVPIESTPAA